VNDVRSQEHEFREFIGKAVLPHLHYFSHLKTGAVVSTTEEDTRLSFDMRVGMWLPVSVRIRSSHYFEKYRGDFSIRSKTAYSGQIVGGSVVACELDKLKAGHGNCYFYGWLSPDKTEIENYMLIDMSRFRPHLDRGVDRPNTDGKTWGRYFNIDLVRNAGALVYQSWEDFEVAAYG